MYDKKESFYSHKMNLFSVYLTVYEKKKMKKVSAKFQEKKAGNAWKKNIR